MKIELYNEDKHYNMLKKWYQDHGQQMMDKDLYPKIGLVINDIVAGFLYQTDSKLGIVENYISDKNSTKEQREEAIIELTGELFKIAKEMGCSTLISFTSNKGLLEKQPSLGYTVIAKDMNVIMRRL